MKRLTRSEKIFKIFSYVLLTIFAIICIYPLIFVLSGAISSKDAVESGRVVLWPVGFQLDALMGVIGYRQYWLGYCNTIFYTVYGTICSMLVAITGAYALSKPRLMFGKGFNFMLVFTLWFNAGMIPTLQNFTDLGIVNSRFGYILGLGFNAFNIVLLRNYFAGVPTEIEEAATIDGATEFQILTKIYIPMSKASIATVTMFYALSRWNGYIWASMLFTNENYQPLTVIIRNYLATTENSEQAPPIPESPLYSNQSVQYAMLLCSIIPIIVVYPQLQKYFAAGVNVGGVKE